MTCVLITGSEGAIGRALVSAFAANHFRVIGLDVRNPSNPDCAEFVQADLLRLVDDSAYQASIVAEIRAKAGSDGLGALINNAAVQILGDFQRITIAQWDQALKVNLMAPVVLIRGMFDDLARNRGAVVNISSIHAQQTKPAFSAYATSKAALSGLTRALATECGKSFRVNTISPAAIDTPMLRSGFDDQPERYAALAACHPVGRIGTPEDVAALSVFLCSPAAAFINGADFGLDGGVAGRLHDPV